MNNVTSAPSITLSRRSALTIGAFTLIVGILISTFSAAASRAAVVQDESRVEAIREAKAAGPAATGSYIVVYRDKVSLSSRLRAERAEGIDIEETYRDVFKGFAAPLEAEDVRRLRQDDAVLIVEPDQTVTTQSNGSQDRSTPSWGIDRIDQRDLPLDSRLVTSDNGFGVEAYIIDTGIRLDHTEFAGRVNPEGFSAVPGGWDDCDGHGTHVAGTVAGSTYGVASRTRLTAVRVLDCEGSGSYSGVIAGIDWMVGDHQSGEPAVGNMSLGGPQSESVNLAIQRAVDDGISMVVAAGNESGNACSRSPASARAALTVGSTDNSDAMSWFSNMGRCVDLYAPGSNIRSASAGSPNAVESLSGTSMASPHVAGTVALELSRNQAMTPGAVTDRVVASASPNRITGLRGCTINRLLYSRSGADLPAPSLPDAPPNDNFVNRQTLSSLGAVNGNSACATAEAGELGHSQPAAHESVWYSWTAPSNGTLVLETTGSSFDTTLAVYTGTSMGALTQRAANDDTGSGLTSRVSLPVEAGTTYSVAIDGYNGESGITRLSGSFTSGGGGTPEDPPEEPPTQPRPANDDFADASRISFFNSPITGTNEAATAEIGEPSHSITDDDPIASIWYRWTPQSDGILELDAQISSFKADIAVYLGSSVNSLTQVGVGWGEATVPVRAGNSYAIALDTLSQSRVGETRLTGEFTQAPANDHFADASRISSFNSPITGTNVAATAEIGEPSHSIIDEDPVASIWYHWTPQSNGILELDTQGSSFRADIAVYSGSSVDSLTQLEVGWEDVTVPVRAGNSYAIALDTGAQSQVGQTRLSGEFTLAPPNDDRANAITVSEWSGGLNGTLLGATSEPGEPFHNPDGYEEQSEFHSVWYKWTAPWSGMVEMESRDDSFYDISVYTEGSQNNLRPVISEWLSPQWKVHRGTTYWVAVSTTGISDTDDPSLFEFALYRKLGRTEIVAGPERITGSRVARFRFGGEEAVTFECRLDQQISWSRCGQGPKFRRLKSGRHVLRVRQRYGTSSSNRWVSPTEYRWFIKKKR